MKKSVILVGFLLVLSVFVLNISMGVAGNHTNDGGNSGSNGNNAANLQGEAQGYQCLEDLLDEKTQGDLPCKNRFSLFWL